MKKDTLESEFLEALTNVSRKIRTAFNQQVMTHGLTYPRARALLRLARKPDMNQSELAYELELEQPTLVRLLDRMEENGLIKRQPDPGDRRVKLVVLTSLGEEQAEIVKAVGQNLRERIFSEIGADDLQASIGLFARIAANVAELDHADGRS